jgi:diaminohydroxyphosphoribosylaminopyrimidine deaminase/5-amino-6-(5-phosphoribosylamino)uracil reductase
VVVDSSGRIGPEARIFDGRGNTLIATTLSAPHEAQTAWKEAGAEVIALPAHDRGVDLPELLTALGRRGVLDLYCEGGAELATSLLAAGLVDRLELHFAPKFGGDGGPRIGDLGAASLLSAEGWLITETARCGEDLLVSLERGET